jgi:predicted Zn-dependent peptidase
LPENGQEKRRGERRWKVKKTVLYPPDLLALKKRVRTLVKSRFFIFISYWFVISQLFGNLPLNGQSPEDQVGFRKLDNGLAVVLIRRYDAPTLTAVCGFKAGGVDDPPGFSGTAHLVEHLMSRRTLDPFQTKKLYGELSGEYSKGGGMDPQKIKDLESKIAALENQIKEVKVGAITTFDFVYYSGTLPSSQLELFCRMESALLKEPLPEGVMEERENLLAERKREWDVSAGNFSEQIQALTFGDRPYGRLVAGRPNEILAITPAVALDFKKKHYIPNNCVLVFVGNLNPKELFPLIEKYFGNFPRRKEPAPAKMSEPPARRERRLILQVETKSEIFINFLKPAFPHKDDLVSRVLGIILTKGEGSRLNLDLIKTRKIADEVTAGWGPGERFENAYGFSVVPNAGHSPEEVETALLKQLETLKTDPVDEDELQKAKDEITNDLDGETQSALQVAMAAMRYQLIHGDWKLGFKTKEFCKGVTPNDIREFARKCFTPENRTTIIFMKKRLG